MLPSRWFAAPVPHGPCGAIDGQACAVATWRKTERLRHAVPLMMMVHAGMNPQGAPTKDRVNHQDKVHKALAADGPPAPSPDDGC
jgi:hypothetical protein